MSRVFLQKYAHVYLVCCLTRIELLQDDIYGEDIYGGVSEVGRSDTAVPSSNGYANQVCWKKQAKPADLCSLVQTVYIKHTCCRLASKLSELQR
jgi:hypothetical protein